MTLKVHTPVEGFTGIVAGVAFADGAGETSDPNAITYFKRHGYKIEASEPVKKAPAKKSAPKPTEK